MNTVNQLVQKYHETAKSKGWHEIPRSPAEIHMLIVTEIAEATEAYRNGLPPVYVVNEQGEKVVPALMDMGLIDPDTCHLKCEGEAVELADAVIRIFDYFGARGWNMEHILTMKDMYNATRSHRHGGKVI